MKCDGCRRSFRKISLGPMLLGDVWCSLAAEHETLCFECILSRATERQVDLSLASLVPCPLNLRDWPHSYFNLFRSTERQPLARQVLDDWRWQAWAARTWPEIGPRVWAELK
jgi:hypothetical protein